MTPTAATSTPSTITARAVVQGLHNWPDAPERRAYLRSLHRHQFQVSATLEVSHGGREVEFHDLGEALEQILRGAGESYHHESTLVSFGGRSCEHLADFVAARLQADGFQPLSVTVSEDGEHDATWRA